MKTNEKRREAAQRHYNILRNHVNRIRKTNVSNESLARWTATLVQAKNDWLSLC